TPAIIIRSVSRQPLRRRKATTAEAAVATPNGTGLERSAFGLSGNRLRPNGEKIPNISEASMSKRRASARLIAVLAIVALPLTVAAQNASHPRHRAASPPAGGDITILQTTDLHDHANGSGHVGLDVNPATGTSLTGAYARIAAYVNEVRATAGHPVILVDSGDWTMGTLYDLTLG